jgi:hypothetical protein
MASMKNYRIKAWVGIALCLAASATWGLLNFRHSHRARTFTLRHPDRSLEQVHGSAKAAVEGSGQAGISEHESVNRYTRSAAKVEGSGQAGISEHETTVPERKPEQDIAASAVVANLEFDPGATDEFGASVLHQAVEKGEIQAVEAFIRQGADVNARDRNGDTSLAIAAEKNDLKTARILLAGGGDVNTKNLYGDTPLMLAVSGGFAELTALLLKAGADADIKNHDDETAVTLAAETRNPTIIGLLAKRKR